MVQAPKSGDSGWEYKQGIYSNFSKAEPTPNKGTVGRLSSSAPDTKQTHRVTFINSSDFSQFSIGPNNVANW